MPDTGASVARGKANAPPKLTAFAHVSVPCRDLEEGKRFYRDVLGGEMVVDTPTFCSFVLGGVQVGIGTVGCSWTDAENEYPHFAFYVDADTLVQMQGWLARCGIPTSNLWTRGGVEALMFFRDPSGNVIELYCKQGYKGAEALPKGPPRGHGTAVDITKLLYKSWNPPAAR
jgi:catechol 2,3-dioxygenase-like lactoylglutathione lyase family enzyme